MGREKRITWRWYTRWKSMGQVKLFVILNEYYSLCCSGYFPPSVVKGISVNALLPFVIGYNNSRDVLLSACRCHRVWMLELNWWLVVNSRYYFEILFTRFSFAMMMMNFYIFYLKGLPLILYLVVISNEMKNCFCEKNALMLLPVKFVIP